MKEWLNYGYGDWRLAIVFVVIFTITVIGVNLYLKHR